MEQQSRALDPVALLHRIRERQEALAALTSRENNKLGPGQESLEQFMKQLGELWRQSEVRATHRTSPKKAHSWRTRKYPFEEDWPTVLLWQQGREKRLSLITIGKFVPELPDISR